MGVVLCPHPHCSTVSMAMNSPIYPFLIQIHPECEVIHVRLQVVGAQVVFSIQI